MLVSFPLIESDAEIEVLRLDFTGRLFSVGGQVQAFARFTGDGDGETVWQQVDGGDAAEGVDSNSLLVVGIQKHRQLMTAFDIPAVFTPNGDGVNDELVPPIRGRARGRQSSGGGFRVRPERSVGSHPADNRRR